MLIKVSFNPESVVHQGSGHVLVEVDPRHDPAFPIWLTTGEGTTHEEFHDGNEPKDARYVHVSRRGTISVGERWTKP